MTMVLKQGVLNFRSGYKRQTRWGRSEASVFALESAGAPLVVATLATGAPLAAMVLGLVMVAAAITLLFLHLGNPQRAWMAIRNVRHSWISRGTLVLGGFVGLGAFYVLLRFAGAPSTGIEAPIRYMLYAAGVFIPLYPGLVLSASPAIPFWNSGLLPVLSLIQGVASAATIWLASASGDMAAGVPLPLVVLWLVLTHAAVTALYLAAMQQRSGAAARSVRDLIAAQPLAFWACGCGLGLAVPLAVTLWLALSGPLPLAVVAAAALARFAGDLALRHAILKAGMFDPVI